MKDNSLVEDYNSKSLSDNEESISVSVINTTHMNTSQINISDIKDIIYNSKSPLEAANQIISE